MALSIQPSLDIESAKPTRRAGAIAFLVLVIVLVLLICISAVLMTRAHIRKRRQAHAPIAHPLDNAATDAVPLPCFDCTIRIGAWHAARDRAGQPVDIEAGPQPCLGCRIRLGGWHAVRAHAARFAPGQRFEMVSYSTGESHTRVEQPPATDTRSDATKARTLREEDITESAQ